MSKSKSRRVCWGLTVDLVTSGAVADNEAANKVVLDYVNSVAAQQTSNLKIPVDADGKVLLDANKRLVDVGTADYFDKIGQADLGRPLSTDVASKYAATLSVPTSAVGEAALHNAKLANDLVVSYNQERLDVAKASGDAGRIGLASESFKSANMAGMVMGLMLIGSEAMASELSGDKAGAQKIVSDGLLDFAKSAAIFGGIELAAVAAGAILGLPIAAFVGGALVVYGAYEAIHMLPTLAKSMDNLFSQWTYAKHTLSPLILDLDGDFVVETQSKTEGIYFDHAGDGFAEATGWAGSDDGLLVRDLNGDGAINNGGELFGNNTRLSNGQNAANGFEALADLDSNRDGKINSADAAWNTLRVWKDTDSDAQTDTGELLTLAEAGVKEVNLAYTNTSGTPDQHGNEHKQSGSYTTTAGTTRAVHDVWFGTDNWNTIDQRTPIELSSTVAAMPEVIGAGMLGSLRQAMMRDASGQLIAAMNTEYTKAA